MKKLIFLLFIIIILNSCTPYIWHQKIYQYNNGVTVKYWENYSIGSGYVKDNRYIFSLMGDTIIIINGDYTIIQTLIKNDSIYNILKNKDIPY